MTSIRNAVMRAVEPRPRTAGFETGCRPHRTARVVTLLLVTLLAAGAYAVGQTQDDELRGIRERIERRYDVVPLTGGVALRPKTETRDLRLIELADGAIVINGTPVTGREVRDRLGADADAILRLSYMAVDRQRALFAPEKTTPSAGDASRDSQPPLERVEPAPSREPRRARRSQGDRVRIFGDVTVAEDEEITGQVIAVMGSVRVNGEVGDQVVAVLGSVELGPHAVVGGDIVSVGGRVRRSPTAQVRKAVTEVSISDSNLHLRLPWFDAVGPWPFFVSFGALPRLLGTGFRLVLLLLLTGMAFLVARRGVESAAQRVSDSPVKMTIVGLLAEILVAPVLLLMGLVLAVSIIGIPLLLLLPFLVVLLLLMAVVGFAGTAAAIGNSVQRRLTHDGSSPFLSVAIGVLVILSPLLVGRVIALAGWPATPIAVLLVALGFSVELLAWASGFGAMLTNSFTRWQAQRASRAAASV
jgi:hypothetical protein